MRACMYRLVQYMLVLIIGAVDSDLIPVTPPHPRYWKWKRRGKCEKTFFCGLTSVL